MEEDNLIVVFYMNNTLWYNLNFYDFYLQLNAENISINAQVEDPFYDGVFFKGIYLKEKYSALMYYLKHEDGKTLYLEILNMNIIEGNFEGYDSILKINDEL